MNDLKTRLKTRSYIAATGFFYLLVGIFYSVDYLRLDHVFQPSPLWSSAFILSGVISLLAWANKSYQASRKSLYLSGSLAAGFAVAFLQQSLAIPDAHYLLGVLIWAYIAVSHLSVARLPDPYVVALFEQEFKTIAELSRELNE